MFPLKDNNPTQNFPIITVFLIIANTIMYFYSNMLGTTGKDSYLQFAVIPDNVMSLGRDTGQGPIKALSTVITSQFLHGSLLHIVGNMLFLWIFGNNVEDRLGKMLSSYFIRFAEQRPHIPRYWAIRHLKYLCWVLPARWPGSWGPIFLCFPEPGF